MLLCSSAPLCAQGGEKSLVVEVKSATGQPLPHACVTFVPKAGDIIFRQADAHGRVRLRKVAADRYRIVVKVDGYEAQKKEVVVQENSGAIAFLLQPRTGQR